MVSFEISAQNGNARLGKLFTAHGVINTPCFMPVGTAATVKGLIPEMVEATGAEIILANTYHLMLRPGAKRIENLGGLHRFMQWSRPILTDSGGFQVMSLAKLRTLSEEGVCFQSPYDGGQKHLLTPEVSIEIQHQLGSTITMVFDECTPYPATEMQADKSMQLSMRWALRSKNAFQIRDGYGLFGIVQGGTYLHLREESAKKLQEISFDGYAIGGLAVGEGQAEMFRVLDGTVQHLPQNKPRYLMGVGKPLDIVGAVLRGVDMFDCVLPTRSGRNGQAFTWNGAFSIRNARFSDDAEPIDSACSCYACARYSRAYIQHLFKADEMLGPILLSLHNVTFYQNLMSSLRIAIEEGTLEKFAEACFARWQKQDEEDGA